MSTKKYRQERRRMSRALKKMRLQAIRWKPGDSILFFNLGGCRIDVLGVDGNDIELAESIIHNRNSNTETKI